MNRFFLLTIGAVVGGCGGMGRSAAADPAAYQRLTQDVTALVETHRAAAADTTSVEACLAEHARYDFEVRPKLETMQSQSEGMDSCMMKMGRPGDATLFATCGSMRSELNSHKTAACASADTAVNKREAVRHCNAMKTWLDSEKNRADSLTNGCR